MTYRAVYEQDESGHWIVTVPRVDGCHSYGRTIEQARERIREALGLFVANADTAEITDDVRLPQPILRRVKAVDVARRMAKRQQVAFLKAQRVAARRLVEHGLSYRDAGEMLGVTRQRAQQLVKEEPTA